MDMLAVFTLSDQKCTFLQQVIIAFNCLTRYHSCVEELDIMIEIFMSCMLRRLLFMHNCIYRQKLLHDDNNL